jgi:membrane-bound lytic murein transglycosylase D
MPVQYNERVQQYLDLYANRRRTVFTSWLRRMGRYRGYIEQRLADAGLPRELVYLPLIESGYETTVSSSASAVGLWQFMSGTARAEGLEVSDYVDERRDPFRSTDAAVRHLRGLYKTFGSWYLAAAAYNSGDGRIARLLKSYGLPLKAQDDAYWLMQDALPTETRSYVPGLLAAVIIGENREMFGVDSRSDAPIRFESVYVPRSTPLSAVAEAAHATIDEIRDLNPQYLRGVTPPDREAEVRVPVGAAQSFTLAAAAIPTAVHVSVPEAARPKTRTHIVEAGETLSEIAAEYGTTVEAIQKANHIERASKIAAGRKLTIPVGRARDVYGTE